MLMASRAKVFENNQTYAVRIPQELNFHAEEVYMNKIGDVLMITPVGRLAETLERGAAILASYSEDFMKDGLPEEIPAVKLDTNAVIMEIKYPDRPIFQKIKAPRKSSVQK